METNSKDFAGPPGGVVKNSITGKTIREMTWDEILSLAGEPMTPAEARRQMEALRAERQKKSPR